MQGIISKIFRRKSGNKIIDVSRFVTIQDLNKTSVGDNIVDCNGEVIDSVKIEQCHKRLTLNFKDGVKWVFQY